MEVVHFPSPSHSMDAHLMRGESAAYLSCPSGLSFIGSPQYYTAPSSPTRGLTADPFSLEAPAVEKAKTEAGSDSDDFEFEISFEQSERFDSASIQQQAEQQQAEEIPTNMAFADELFSNGRVLPLKLPPRLQSPSYGSWNTSHLRSSSSLLLYGPSSGLSFKNKDFDPFEAALEKVRKEESAGNPPVGHRRARSFSPRTYHWREERARADPPPIVKPTGSAVTNARSNLLPVMPAELKRHDEPVESQLGRSKPMGNSTDSGKERRPTGPIRSSSESPAQDEHNDKVVVKKSFSWKGSKRQIIRDFLFRSASEGRVDSKDKLRAHTAAIQSYSGPKDLSFGSAQVVLYKGSDEARKKTSMAYKPSNMFSCWRMKDQKKKKKRRTEWD
ncbi:uncharacterized protein [Aristolochia californica]|uniref:uncharacterized protein n=1 Tax=Aristolochia californica TaxID=171875 RepID=UPI0035E0A86E